VIVRPTLLLMLCCASLPVHAQDFSVHGFADFRLVAAPDETSWTQGGLGKARYGGGDDGAHVGAAAVVAHWQFAPAWLAVADLRYQPDFGSSVALTEAFLRFRPVSTSAWRCSLKLGEFFAPISLENEGIGWTSLWTLTPSAIDSWIGDEMRTVGGELRVEHRGEENTLEGAVALFGANDPLGEIIAARGWSFDDLVAGFGSRVREPDAYAEMIGVTPPRRYDPFLEIDHHVGAYADLTWRSDAYGRTTLLYYDNLADPSDYHTFDHDDQLFAWRTRFTSLGTQTQLGGWTFIAQAMNGSTEIHPPFFRSIMHFSAGYLLAGWDLGAWRPALRVDAFTTRADPKSSAGLSEHGNALTLALNWRPLEWLRLTAEALRVFSWREQRLAAGLDPRQVDSQLMLNARLLF
jgi:hypothetical protein